MDKTYGTPHGTVKVKASLEAGWEKILSPEALAFVAKLHRLFNPMRLELLERREKRQALIDQGQLPDFLPQTRHIRESEWTVNPLPADLQDRRVEITGPVERKMVINALNSGAKVFMADFEDSNSPTWHNAIQGQLNLRDAINRSISYTNPANGKQYRLNETIATLMVRPRGWHLDEKHVTIDGEIASGSIFDFGLFFFHNAKQLLANGSGPYFYLPKLESHLEARLWNDVFLAAQYELGVPRGTIKATVLIETILASFELNEILYELREHSAGLNCGRWDYIFSYIKRLQKHDRFLVPDRAQVGMTKHFMRSYSQLVIQTCHRREVHAMGGMAAQIPIKNDEEANRLALDKVREDKEREARDGHDGTWVAHPGLVQLAMDVFDQHMPTPNQIHRKREDVSVTASDLLQVPEGEITREGVVKNIDIGIQYLASWLGGNGCVPIYNLMEDAATAEISRTQLWQWLHHSQAKLNDGTPVDEKLYDELVPVALERIRKAVGDTEFEHGHYSEAVHMFEKLSKADELQEFLTLEAYQHI